MENGENYLKHTFILLLIDLTIDYIDYRGFFTNKGTIQIGLLLSNLLQLKKDMKESL